MIAVHNHPSGDVLTIV
ncbi:MAG: hypothetical protein LBE43_04660 [Staphylococcus aureus]|nr:hypothetical protein [Staphylococcus aureus]